MYKIIATEDFINLLKDLPLRYLHLITDSFIYIGKEESCDVNGKGFLQDLLEQMKNQELE